LEDEEGKKVRMKKGAQVDVTIDADDKDTTPRTNQHEEYVSATRVFDVLTFQPPT